jgi:hypothetical protein
LIDRHEGREARGMGGDYISYAFQDLPRKKIVKYAAQYEGVDMAKLMEADEENFPFLFRSGDADDLVMFWNAYNGVMAYVDEDPVRKYATARYLRENAYPVFGSLQEVETYAQEHDWPRKPRQR